MGLRKKGDMRIFSIGSNGDSAKVSISSRWATYLWRGLTTAALALLAGNQYGVLPWTQKPSASTAQAQAQAVPQPGPIDQADCVEAVIDELQKRGYLVRRLSTFKQGKGRSD